jgi:regulator of protease activity HflC (stomatin/prohibitin superfamily)
MALAAIMMLSCTTVDSGSAGVPVSWGGKTGTEVLDEGVNYGLNYIVDDVVEYSVREQTITLKKEYNDIKDMPVPVEVTLYFRPVKKSLTRLHKEVGQDYQTVKLKPLFLGALKEVIPQYSAQGLNKTDRAAAESKIKTILDKDLGSIYVECVRVSITDVDIPVGISNKATAIAVQESSNMLASKKEAEKVALASALIAESKGKYEAALYDAKTKDIMSQPKMLELKRLENEAIMWDGFRRHGKSPYGQNNMFGVNSPNLLKNIK